MKTVASDVRYRRVGDELVAVRQAAAEVVVLNETGARILELTARERSQDEIVEQMMREFEIDRETLEQDVGDCLSELTMLGLLEEAPPRAPSSES